MSYFDGIFRPCANRYLDNSPTAPADSCMVFNMSKGARLVASRMCAGLTPPASLGAIMSSDELAYLREYLGGYHERPVAVNTSYGQAVAISSLYPSTSLCVLSIANVGGENFLRVAKNQGWELELSPSVAKRQLRSTGIREGHLEESARLWNTLRDCFAPLPCGCGLSFRELLEDKTVAITEYASRRARITSEEEVLILDDLDLPLYLAFLLLFTLSGRENGAEECAKISVFDRSCGLEAVIVEKAGRDRARISRVLAEICGRANVPFEYFYEDGRVLARIVPIRKDWAYLGIKSPERE